jgi:hypothetical protein
MRKRDRRVQSSTANEQPPALLRTMAFPGIGSDWGTGLKSFIR